MNESTDTETKVCPRCRAEIVPVPIVYGYPSPELFLEADAGKVKLGGCIVGDESPDFACPACDAPLPFVNPAPRMGIATVRLG
jgi:rubrerythrin